ncbi:MAG: BrnA antitoxin family protein [Anaerolineae bacterium]|nr:BrnA antitoxin family protein [Anaerolineae bacterium]
MVEKIDPIPEEMTIAEASVFWDTHSVADYPSSVVQLDFEPDASPTIIIIAAELVDGLHKRATASGVSVETLVNLWVQEKLASV